MSRIKKIAMSTNLSDDPTPVATEPPTQPARAAYNIQDNAPTAQAESLQRGGAWHNQNLSTTRGKCGGAPTLTASPLSSFCAATRHRERAFG